MEEGQANSWFASIKTNHNHYFKRIAWQLTALVELYPHPLTLDSFQNFGERPQVGKHTVKVETDVLSVLL